MREYQSDKMLVELQYLSAQIRELDISIREQEEIDERNGFEAFPINGDPLIQEQCVLCMEREDLCNKYIHTRLIEIHIFELPLAEEIEKVMQVLRDNNYPFPSASPHSVEYDDDLPF